MATPPASALWQGPTLVLDCSTTHTQIGILENADWLAFIETEGEALETIFRSLNTLLSQTRRSLSGINSVAIGIGPGSILGLRLSLIALQTWRKLPQLQHWHCSEFHGLHLQAQLLLAQTQKDFHLVSDFRGSSWHQLSVHAGTIGELQVIDHQTLKALEGTVYYSPTGRGRQKMPLETSTTAPFSLSELPTIAPLPWTRPTENPELYLPVPPVFKKWDARPHTGHA